MPIFEIYRRMRALSPDRLVEGGVQPRRRLRGRWRLASPSMAGLPCRRPGRPLPFQADLAHRPTTSNTVLRFDEMEPETVEFSIAMAAPCTSLLAAQAANSHQIGV